MARPRTRTKLLWTAGALLAGLAAAEFVARWRSAGPPGRPRAEGEVLMPSADPELRFENRPGAQVCLIYPDAQGERRVLAHVNALGWRGRPIEQARTPGVLRIAAVGDSHTFGAGVADDEPWPAVLERELAREGTRVEVLNAGVDGYDAEQVLALLEKRVAAWAPDLVVYGFFCNDVASPPLAPAAQQELVHGAQPPPGWLARLCAGSRLVQLVSENSERRTRWSHWADVLAGSYAEDSPGWQRLRPALQRTHERIEAGGGRFVVLLFPLLVPAPAGLVGTIAHRRVGEFCAGARIPCLDLEPSFAGLDLDRLRVHPLDLHAGTEAHRIAGTALARWLREQGLLAAPAPR